MNLNKIKIKCPHCGSTNVALYIHHSVWIVIENDEMVDDFGDYESYYMCLSCKNEFRLDNDDTKINGIYIENLAVRRIFGPYFFNIETWDELKKYFFDSNLYKSFMKFIQMCIMGP